MKKDTARYAPAHPTSLNGSKPVDPASMRQPPSPYDLTLSLAARAWLGELPPQVAPTELAARYPRIVNRLARFWNSPRMIDQYFEQLLIDSRGRRKGSPGRSCRSSVRAGRVPPGAAR